MYSIINFCYYLLCALTIDTSMEVVVDELCSITVARMPIIKLAKGLANIALLLKISPVAAPLIV